MTNPRSSLGFGFPYFTRTRARTRTRKKRTEPQLAREPSQRDQDFLTTQLSAANKQNSLLRKEISDQRDSNAQQIHSLRQQKSFLEARVAALSQENETVNNELDTSTKKHHVAHTTLRVENESLKRQISDSERKIKIIKSAVKELTQELTAVNDLHAAAKQELRIVRREREAALDDACTVQNLLERERTEHEHREHALQKEIINLRKEQYLSHGSRADIDATALPLAIEDTFSTKDPFSECADVNPLATDSVSTETLTPREENNKYHVLFSPQIPMTPIRALDNSDYVIKGHSFDSLRESAYAKVVFGRAVMAFTMILNEPFSAWGSAERPTMTYIGFEYPDGTSLCYVPLRDLRVKHLSTQIATQKLSADQTLGAEYGRDYVHLCIREEVYASLIEQAKAVFATRYSTEKVELPRVSYDHWSDGKSRTVSLAASMKPDARVERKLNGSNQKTLVSKELFDKREDILGDGLLAMRFRKAYAYQSGYTLEFKLHGIFAGTL